MSLSITNLTPSRPQDRPHRYRLVLKTLCVEFEHDRRRGLSELLRRAAAAVDAYEFSKTANTIASHHVAV